MEVDKTVEDQAKNDFSEIRVPYDIYFLKPDKNDWVSKLVGLGLKLMGSDPDYTHVAITQASDEGHLRSLIELTTEGLDTTFFFMFDDEDYAEQLQEEVKKEIKERFTASVTLSITLRHHVQYLQSLESLVRSKCSANVWDFLAIFSGRTNSQPVCTYPVLEMLGMKHNAYVLPKNLFEYFSDACARGQYVLDNDVEILSCRSLSHDQDP